jgi:hypothetical protein
MLSTASSPSAAQASLRTRPVGARASARGLYLAEPWRSARHGLLIMVRSGAAQ